MLKAKDIMTSQVHSVSPDTGIEELARLFLDRNVNAMPVVDADGKLFGVVSQGDLVEMDRPLHIPTVITLFDWVLYVEAKRNSARNWSGLPPARSRKSAGATCRPARRKLR